MKNWYQFKNETTASNVAEIHIIDFIGDWYDEFYKQFGYETGVTAKSFVDELAKLPATVDTIRVYINSPGGDVFGSLNIANALREQAMSKGRTVETIVTGVAASIASVIAMAGSKVTMNDNALMMIHQPWSVAIGNAAEMRKQADTLDTITTSLVASYQWHSTLSADEIIALLSAETWMTADEAVAGGFATDKVEGLKAAASINPKTLAALKVPEQYRDRVQALLQPAESPAKTADDVIEDRVTDAFNALEVVDICEAGGCPELARALIQDKATPEQATARVTAAKQQKTAAAARASEIRALCATAKLPDLADGYVNGGMTPADVRTHLTTVTAKLDSAAIDAGLKPDAGSLTKQAAALSASAIYAKRNNPTKEN